jgi:HAD superfamily hydrolase (TIGR01509 family)
VFDFDGLVLDTETPLFQAWQEIFAEVGLSVSEAHWAAMLGAEADPKGPYEFLERHLCRPVDREALRQRRLRREEVLLEGEAPLPGVRSTLAEARSRGLHVAIASSSDRPWVSRHLSHFGLDRFFETVVCADDVARTKPAPDLYLEALRRLGVSSAEAIAFEDSDHGAAAAKAANLFCVLVPNTITRHHVPAHADLVLGSLEEVALVDLLRIAEGWRPS